MITIVIVPADIRQRGFSDISFLGSILDDDSFRREFKDFYPYSDDRYPRRDRLLLSAKEDVASRHFSIDTDSDYLSEERPYRVSIGEILQVGKRHPVAAVGGEIQPEPTEAVSEIGGQAKGRAVLFKPPAPDCRGLASESKEGLIEGDFYKVRLKIIIASDGSIEAVEKLESSGFPTVDLLAIRYVKKWNFIPLSPDKPQDDQEGTLLLKLKAR